MTARSDAGRDGDAQVADGDAGEHRERVVALRRWSGLADAEEVAADAEGADDGGVLEHRDDHAAQRRDEAAQRLGQDDLAAATG